MSFLWAIPRRSLNRIKRRDIGNLLLRVCARFRGARPRNTNSDVQRRRRPRSETKQHASRVGFNLPVERRSRVEIGEGGCLVVLALHEGGGRIEAEVDLVGAFAKRGRESAAPSDARPVRGRVWGHGDLSVALEASG